jgi:hypothetical protein
MSASAESVREKVRRLADELPPEATWKDVLYEAYVRQEIEAGLILKGARRLVRSSIVISGRQ